MWYVGLTIDHDTGDAGRQNLSDPAWFASFKEANQYFEERGFRDVSYGRTTHIALKRARAWFHGLMCHRRSPAVFRKITDKFPELGVLAPDAPQGPPARRELTKRLLEEEERRGEVESLWEFVTRIQLGRERDPSQRPYESPYGQFAQETDARVLRHWNDRYTYKPTYVFDYRTGLVSVHRDSKLWSAIRAQGLCAVVHLAEDIQWHRNPVVAARILEGIIRALCSGGLDETLKTIEGHLARSKHTGDWDDVCASRLLSETCAPIAAAVAPIPGYDREYWCGWPRGLYSFLQEAQHRR